MKKKLVLNTLISILLQITTVICGFILPRLMLEYYGSEVNGLVQSIAQFLGIISFLEMGVGQVIQSSLYEPISACDNIGVSKIVKSGSNYFRKIAVVMLIYITVLCLVYPYLFGNNYDYGFIVTLIIAMGVSSLTQYYFGLIDRILLSADQKGYIQFITQIVSNIVNVTVIAYLIYSGHTIHTVKWVSATVFLLGPAIIRLYINKNYKIDRKIKYSEEPVKQKWNGIAQHISNVVLEGTDVIILTVFSTLTNVSIYSVYYMVISGVRQLYTAATAGVQSMIGALWANKDKEKLETVFQKAEIVLHFSTVFLFSCIAHLIVPFIKVYTSGINDGNYIQPSFALVITLAYAIRCLRTPYNILVLAGGHYKQTQSCHIVSAILNIVVSVVAVKIWGLVGIAIGTLIAFSYQTIWMMIYNSKNLLKWPLRKMAKQLFADLLTTLLICTAAYWVKLNEISYFGWFVMAVTVAAIALIVTISVAFIFYGSELKNIIKNKIGRNHV